MAGSALFVCPLQGRWTCVSGSRGLRAPRPGPLSFLFSYQRPDAYQFQISQEQRERETTDRKGIFFYPSPLLFFSLLARLTECLPPSRFTEESNYSLGLNLATFRRQPTDKGSRLREQSVDQHFSLSSKKLSGFQW